MKFDFNAHDCVTLDDAFHALEARMKRMPKIFPGTYEFRQYVEAHGGVIKEVATDVAGIHGTVNVASLSLDHLGDRQLELEIAAGIASDLGHIGLGSSISLPKTLHDDVIVHVYFR